MSIDSWSSATSGRDGPRSTTDGRRAIGAAGCAGSRGAAAGRASEAIVILIIVGWVVVGSLMIASASRLARVHGNAVVAVAQDTLPLLLLPGVGRRADRSVGGPRPARRGERRAHRLSPR